MHVKCQELVTELMQYPLHEHCTHVLRTFLSFLINSALPLCHKCGTHCTFWQQVRVTVRHALLFLAAFCHVGEEYRDHIWPLSSFFVELDTELLSQLHHGQPWHTKEAKQMCVEKSA